MTDKEIEAKAEQSARLLLLAARIKPMLKIHYGFGHNGLGRILLRFVSEDISFEEANSKLDDLDREYNMHGIPTDRSYVGN